MTMKKILLFLGLLMGALSSYGQSDAYQEKKRRALSEDSPFTKIINRELPATIEYEDDDIIAFVPLRRQAPVHFLIVPKKPIPTINDIAQEDTQILGKMFQVAKLIAQQNGIAETGYRLSMNNNEDSGQSVFHIHMHLLGGKKLGPMVTQDFVDER